MQFSRLRLRGFKSFSDEVELPIAEGLTGVVGPNGCGKSNVVEALRWVMGESSARDLRGSEMDDVLFGGSALRPAFDVAEVALMVSNTTPLPVDADEQDTNSNVYGLAEARAQHWGSDLEISRRIERGHGSTYRINKREVRARDVQLIFADAAAGSRSPALISQGKVTTIIEAKPEDRRRLLEDAAGIGGLHSRRREAELKLNATEANLARVRDRLTDLEQDLEGLQRQAREAERYRKVSEEINYFDQLLLLARVLQAETNLAQTIEVEENTSIACEQSTKELEEAAIALAGISRELPGVQEHITQLSSQIAGGREKLERLLEIAATQRRDQARIDQSIAQANQELERITGSLAEKSEALPNLQALMASTQTELAHQKELEPQLSAELSQLRQSELQAREALEASLTKLATHQAEQAQAEQNCKTLQARSVEIEAELNRARNVDDEALVKVAERQEAEARLRLEDAQSQATAAQADLEDLLADLTTRRSELDSIRERVETANANWQKLENEKLRLRTLLDAFAHTQQDLETRHDRALSEINRLEREIELIDLQRIQSSLEKAKLDHASLKDALTTGKAEQQLADTQFQLTAKSCDELRQARDNLANELNTFRTEAEALEKLQEDSDPDPVLASLTIQSGYESALSAALGDDLLSGKSNERSRYWQEIEAGMLPAWPQKLETLDRYVSGEPALVLRLAMIAICEDAQEAIRLQPSLQPGQRLVTKEGGLWRWDGFVQSAGAAKPAQERVRQRRRQDELAQLIAQNNQHLINQEEDLAAREAAHAAAILLIEETKRDLTTIEHRLDQEARLIERQTNEFSDKHERLERLKSELLRVTAERDQTHIELQALAKPDGIDPETINEKLAQAQTQKQELGSAMQAIQSALNQCTTLEGQKRSRLKAIGNTVDNARQALSQSQTVFERRRGEAEGRRQARELAIEGLEKDLSVTQERRQQAQDQLILMQDQTQAIQQSKNQNEQLHQNLVQNLDELRSKIAKNTNQTSRLSERLISSSNECQRLSKDIEELTTASQLATEKRLGLESEAQSVAEHALEGQNAAEQAETLEHQLASNEHTLGELRVRLRELEDAQVQANTRKDKATEAAARATEQLSAAQTARTRLQDELDEHQEAAERGISEAPAKLLANERIREALANSSVRQVETQLDQFKKRRERMGAVNLRAAAEIEERQSVFEKLRTEEGELTEAIGRLSAAIADLDKEARKRLVIAFDKVDEHFRRLFVQLFGGGKAHLRLTNIDVPGKAGLELDAMPPGKKLQNISLLSGGEKGLTALALVFALFLSQPSPLCVLDEVDAALDDANVERFVDLMVEIARTTGTRFVVVTHHPLTMARMDRLFGVTMIERGVSRLVSVTLSTAIDMRTTA